MRTIYRLYTERFDNLAPIVCRYFDGATLFETIGIWQGKTELAACIEILGADDDLDQVLLLAEDIRITNGQQSVYVSISHTWLKEVKVNDQTA